MEREKNMQQTDIIVNSRLYLKMNIVSNLKKYRQEIIVKSFLKDNFDIY